MENEDFNKNDKKISKGQALALVCLSVFLCAVISSMIVFCFIKDDVYFKDSVIILSCLLVIVALSISFDNFSVGKLISIKREANKNLERAEKLENEKNEIFNKLIHIGTNSNNKFNLSNSKVTISSTIEDLTCNDEKNYEEEQKIFEKSDTDSTKKKFNRKILKTMILKKYYGESKFRELKWNIKLDEKIIACDKISSRQTFFDAYLETETKEYFIMVINQNLSYPAHDALYIKLNRILSYKNLKNTEKDAQLLIVMARKKDEPAADEFLLSYLNKAIASNLLCVEYVEYTDEDCEKEEKSEDQQLAIIS